MRPRSTAAGNGLLKARDSRGRKRTAAHMQRHAALNPAIPIALANPGIKILPTRIGLATLEHGAPRDGVLP